VGRSETNKKKFISLKKRQEKIYMRAGCTDARCRPRPMEATREEEFITRPAPGDERLHAATRKPMCLAAIDPTAAVPWKGTCQHLTGSALPQYSRFTFKFFSDKRVASYAYGLGNWCYQFFLF